MLTERNTKLTYKTSNNRCGLTLWFQIQQQVFPYPPYHKQKGFEQFSSLAVPLLMVIGFIFIVPAITIKVVSERETGIKVHN
jgi:hypothetical protein